MEQARHAELVKLAQLAELADEKVKLGKSLLAEKTGQLESQAEQSSAGQAEQAEQNEEIATLAKQIKELLYISELDFLCLFTARQALSLLRHGARSRPAIMMLENNIDEEEPVRGGAFLRLRVRPY